VAGPVCLGEAPLRLARPNACSLLSLLFPYASCLLLCCTQTSDLTHALASISVISCSRVRETLPPFMLALYEAALAIEKRYWE